MKNLKGIEIKKSFYQIIMKAKDQRTILTKLRGIRFSQPLYNCYSAQLQLKENVIEHYVIYSIN